MTTTREAAMQKIVERLKTGTRDERLYQANEVLSQLEKIFSDEAKRIISQKNLMLL